MLEQREIDRVRGMWAALATRATITCPPQSGSPDADAFAQLVALADELQRSLPYWCTQLREHNGASWAEIGSALGTHRSSAQQRFGTHTDERPVIPADAEPVAERRGQHR